MPRRVVPICSRPSFVSPAWSSSMWYGMIRCALALIFRPPSSTPLARRSSSSAGRTFGSLTTPLPIAHSLPGYRIPDGIRWNFHFSPSRTIVCPALLPPWKRITRSAFSASRSVTLPLPSSPHCAPTMTKPAMSSRSVRADPASPARTRRRLTVRRGLGCGVWQLDLHPVVHPAQQQRVTAHLDQARHRATADLLAQLGLVEVRRDHHRAPVLVARVDDRVELLEDPRRALLGPDVVDVQQLDGGEALEQDAERGFRPVVERLAQQAQQPRQ